MPLIGIFGIFELIALALFAIAMLLSISYDRRGTEEPKWAVLFIGGAIVLGVFWSSWTFAGIWDYVTSRAFALDALIYLGIGLAYSYLEFVLDARKTARMMKESWASGLASKKALYRFVKTGELAGDLSNYHTKKHIVDGVERLYIADHEIVSATQSYREIFEKAKAGDASMMNAAMGFVQQFISNWRFGNGIIGLTTEEGNPLVVVPVINRKELADHIAAWTVLWPLYAINLIVGDLLVEIWRLTSDFFASLSGRLIRFVFRDTFSV